MTKIEGLTLLDYIEDVAKANIVPMNVAQKRQTRQPVTIEKLLGGVSYSYSGGHASPWKFKNPVPVVKTKQNKTCCYGWWNKQGRWIKNFIRK